MYKIQIILIIDVNENINKLTNFQLSNLHDHLNDLFHCLTKPLYSSLSLLSLSLYWFKINLLFRRSLDKWCPPTVLMTLPNLSNSTILSHDTQFLSSLINCISILSILYRVSVIRFLSYNFTFSCLVGCCGLGFGYYWV